MKKLYLFLFSILLLASCGQDSHHFKIEGRLLQMNQGEFYVYGFGVNGFDTIKVQGGRFAYEMPCEQPTTLTLVFPNFSEQPIFAEPGKTAKIEGDASHLKEMKVKGTKTNELMTSFRQQIANASPPEIKRYAAQFIEDHPESPVGEWILRKHFITSPTPDYKEASRLIGIMLKKQPENGALNRFSRSIVALKNCSVDSRLPNFTAYDINGKLVSSSSLSYGVAVICTWASWSYNSTDMLRQLKTLQSTHSSLKVATFSLDASKRDCRNYLKMNQITFPVVCTGEMFETRPLETLGLLDVPDNVVLKNGKIVARDLSNQDLVKKIESLAP